jgi:hypothetical protein
MKFSFAGKWMELENIILSEVRLRRPKFVFLPHMQIIDPKTAVILLFQNKGRMCTRGIGKGKETKNLNVVDVLTVEE